MGKLSLSVGCNLCLFARNTYIIQAKLPVKPLKDVMRLGSLIRILVWLVRAFHRIFLVLNRAQDSTLHGLATRSRAILSVIRLPQYGT